VFAVLAGLCGYRLRGDGNDGYSTPVGGLASLPLLDGSKITLNTNSRVHFALTATERRVELQEGEAFFDVAKDPSRPFVVQAGGKRVVAVGTKFSVRRDGDAIEVVVTDGKVRVESATRPVFLTPGAIARADESMVSIEHKSVPEAEAHLSWRRGVLMFRDQSLADAVAEFNRYNARKIVITDPAVAALKVEGNFRATNVDAFVRLLESGFAVRASAVENQIVLEPR
jgi:transmembrane sensor